MKARQLSVVGGERTYVVVLDHGDEVRSTLEKFAQENAIAGARLTGIGAFSDVTLGYFDWKRKRYNEIPINEQVEVAAFTGDVAAKDGEPQLHAHLVVGDSRGRAHAGHLIRAHVRPTLELIIVDSPTELRKTIDKRTGLALIAPDRSP